MAREIEALLNVEQAAAYLSVKRRTVVDWARRGDLPCIVLRRGRDGRATFVRFEESVLKKWIEAKRASSPGRR